MLAFAQCMREHGIDMPDPQFENGGRVMIGGGPGEDGEGRSSIRESDEFQAAEEACGDLLGEMRPGSGTNVAPGGGESRPEHRGAAMTRRGFVRAGIGAGRRRRGGRRRGIHGDPRRDARERRPGQRRAAGRATVTTVAVERRTLTIEETLDGTLGYTGETQVAQRARRAR